MPDDLAGLLAQPARERLVRARRAQNHSRPVCRESLRFVLMSHRKRAGAVIFVLALTACSSSSAPKAAQPTVSSADRAFVRDMLVHHERALQIGQLAASRGSDPRVRAFGQRILREQTPERERLQGWVMTLKVRSDPAQDTRMASGYVTDAQYASLQRLHGNQFDRQVLLLSASSETGAVQMAQEELSGGRYSPARALATSIAGARQTEIPELRKLAAAL